MKQAWWCENCDAAGVVSVQEGDGAYAVVSAIRSKHAAWHLWGSEGAPPCEGPALRVLNEEWFVGRIVPELAALPTDAMRLSVLQSIRKKICFDCGAVKKKGLHCLVRC